MNDYSRAQKGEATLGDPGADHREALAAQAVQSRCRMPHATHQSQIEQQLDGAQYRVFRAAESLFNLSNDTRGVS